MPRIPTLNAPPKIWVIYGGKNPEKSIFRPLLGGGRGTGLVTERGETPFVGSSPKLYYGNTDMTAKISRPPSPLTVGRRHSGMLAVNIAARSTNP